MAQAELVGVLVVLHDSDTLIPAFKGLVAGRLIAQTVCHESDLILWQVNGLQGKA